MASFRIHRPPRPSSTQLRNFYLLEREHICRRHNLLREGDKVGMAGKQQDLMGLRQLLNSLKRTPRPLGIEVDEHVIEHDGQWICMARIVAQQRKPHRKVQLLGGPAAQQLRQKPDAVTPFHLELGAIQGRNNARIPARALPRGRRAGPVGPRA